MRRTNIYLDDAQTAALDAAARRAGTSRAEVVRRLLQRATDAEPADLDGDLAAIRESFGVLAGEEPAVLRGPDERARHLTRVGRR